MPLMPTTHAAIDAFEEISFLMVDGERVVRVDVHRALLAGISKSPRRSPKSYLAALEEHRNSIEQIASAKYDDGDYHSYANSTVVPVGMADWAQHIDATAQAAFEQASAPRRSAETRSL
jgi:Protein of unknown function (DUF1488)